MFNSIRTLVSQNKKRYIDENYNLDLSYITPRIIAMAIPGSGIKVIYRNNLVDVAKFLNENHKGHYKIINLSGSYFDEQKFEGEIISYTLWKDHHSPSMKILFEFVNIMDKYLKEDPNNTCVINCNAGKGRTGTLICCYLLFSGRFTDPQDAFDYYSLKRFIRGHGLTHPSQKRYVKYFYKIITDKKCPVPIVRKLVNVSTSCCPYEGYETILPKLKISNNEKENIFNGDSFAFEKGQIDIHRGESIQFNGMLFSSEIFGDILIELFNDNSIKKDDNFGRIAFNVSFLERNKNEFTFNIDEIDPYEFSKDQSVNRNYSIKLRFDPCCKKDEDKYDSPECLCFGCKSTLGNEIKSYRIINKIIPVYEENIKLNNGKQLLFAEKEDDVESVLKDRYKLNDIKLDRRNEEEKQKYEDNCIAF